MVHCSLPAFLLATFFFLSVQPSLSQRTERPPATTRSGNNYGLKAPVNPEECAGSLLGLDLLPDKIRCGFKLIGEEIWFQVTDEEWITRLITQENDGISVDIVSRSKFRGDAGTLPGNTMITGTLLPPRYRKDILANIINDGPAGIRPKIGKLPRELLKEELEFNLVLVKGKTLCHTSRPAENRQTAD